MGTQASHPVDSEISDKEVAVIAQNYLKSWEALSPYLGLDEVANEAIRRTPGGYVEEKKEFLQEWKRRQGSRATFRALIQAARDTKDINFVDKLEKMAQKRVCGMLLVLVHFCALLFMVWVSTL